MKSVKSSAIVLILLLTGLLDAGEKVVHADRHEGIACSTSCRSCHEKFYQLWSTSHHGLAMQHYTAEFAKLSLTPQKDDVIIGEVHYRAGIEGETGWVREHGHNGEKKYPIAHVLGGKNVTI